MNMRRKRLRMSCSGRLGAMVGELVPRVFARVNVGIMSEPRK